jgi:predicted site-specific integrase-resolvase
MKLPDYAKAIGISYTTAWRWWKANKLPHPARQTEDYLPQPPSNKAKKNRVAIYNSFKVLNWRD